MLENIIKNPIETPRGYKTPGHGIALRGPLSQFFSALYLKPLDDALSSMDIVYLRFQDDAIAFCKTKRQFNRCRRRLMEVLQERHLSLSRKNSYMGCISKGFHYLGIYYSPTQPADNIKVTHANDDVMAPSTVVQSFVIGGVKSSYHLRHEAIRIVPHPRTLRKARENVKWMVNHGVSLLKIKHYLHRFVLWWQKTSEVWQYEELLRWFVDTCWEHPPAAIAAGLLYKATLRRTGSSRDGDCRETA